MYSQQVVSGRLTAECRSSTVGGECAGDVEERRAREAT
jgi:hypothetical protein